MKNVKKIISFGGWDFSTMPGTYSILRQAAQPANRELFTKKIVTFLEEHELDGVDIDWEYPGVSAHGINWGCMLTPTQAPDIPDVPSDDPQNGLNYYRLLSSLKTALGSSRTVSFAAPASFWYLKSYPIKKMANEIDYIIYMTYDLHG
jgi:GH18 family chitinase